MEGIIYLCGAIKADKNYKDKFLLAQKILERKGYTVINPTTLPSNMPFDRYMPICFAMVEQADAVCVIRDDYTSKSVDLIMNYAEFQRKPIITLIMYEGFGNSILLNSDSEQWTKEDT